MIDAGKRFWLGAALGTLLGWTLAQQGWLLLSEKACYSPETFFARLSPDSLLVLYQHNPPVWHPPEQVDPPILWLTGNKDRAVSPAAQRRSAAYSQADQQVMPGLRNNLLMEHNYRQTAEIIHRWLVTQEIE